MAISHRVCIVGLDEHEVTEIQSAIEFGIGVVAHQAYHLGRSSEMVSYLSNLATVLARSRRRT